MAWPFTRLLDFVDNLPPFVTASFLNAIQDEIIAQRRGTWWSEPWNYAPVSIGFGGGGTPTPDGRWETVMSGVLPAEELSFAAPSSSAIWWANVRCTTSGAGANYVGLRSLGQVWRAGVGDEPVLAMEGHWGYAPGSLEGAATTGPLWGLVGVDALAGIGAHAALFEVAWPGRFWRCLSTDAVASQTTTTALVVPNSAAARRDRLRIEVSPTAARFFVNDALVATHAVRFPNNAPLRPEFGSVATGPGDLVTWMAGPIRFSTRPT